MKEKILSGRVWKYGDNVNTDVIFPGKYTYTITDRSEMAKHAMEDIDPKFAVNVKKGDIIVAGKNFGCGSSREQAASCLKEAGISCVIAKSFSRLFYRNAINEGLPAISCKEVVDSINDKDEISVNLDQGKIKTKSEEFSFPKFPESVVQMLNEGGLVAYLKKKQEAGSMKQEGRIKKFYSLFLLASCFLLLASSFL